MLAKPSAWIALLLLAGLLAIVPSSSADGRVECSQSVLGAEPAHVRCSDSQDDVHACVGLNQGPDFEYDAFDVFGIREYTKNHPCT